MLKWNNYILKINAYCFSEINNINYNNTVLFRREIFFDIKKHLLNISNELWLLIEKHCTEPLIDP